MDDPGTAGGPLQAARDALKRRAWREAFELYSAADEAEELAPEDLESLAEAADALALLDDVINTYERAHAGYVKQGSQERAAVTAIILATWYAIKGDFAVSRGWRGTAERLLDGLPECAGHARMALGRAGMGLFQGKLDFALQQAQLACEIARRVGDRDVEMSGLHIQGRALLKGGEVEGGMSLIDEAMAAAMTGELGPFASTSILCYTIIACR